MLNVRIAEPRRLDDSSLLSHVPDVHGHVSRSTIILGHHGEEPYGTLYKSSPLPLIRDTQPNDGFPFPRFTPLELISNYDKSRWIRMSPPT